MNMTLMTLWSAALVYLGAFLFHLTSFFKAEPQKNRMAFTWMRLGFLLSTIYFIAQSALAGSVLPVANFSQAVAFFAWSIAFVYLVLLARAQSDSFGLILTPILVLLLFSAGLAFEGEAKAQNIPGGPLFAVHIVSAFFAYASFTISFAASLLYLFQHRELKAKKGGTFYHKLPSLEELERLMYQPMIWGACLLAAAVAVGFVWSKTEYGEYWILDPKTIATTVTALFYFVILYLRLVSSLRATRGAVLTLIAFGFVLFSFIGPRFIQGSHNYLQ